MQRVICCKELMHLFDGEVSLTRTPEDVSDLVDGVLDLSKALSSGPLTTTNQTLLDHMALLMALAVLFPHEIRDDFIAAHDSGRMSVGDIAEEFDIPASCIPTLLNKAWDATRAILLKV